MKTVAFCGSRNGGPKCKNRVRKRVKADDDRGGGYLLGYGEVMKR